MPLCALSGATTITLPKSLTASTRLRMPGAVMPSSLVISIVGSCFAFAICIIYQGRKSIMLIAVALKLHNRLHLNLTKPQPVKRQLSLKIATI